MSQSIMCKRKAAADIQRGGVSGAAGSSRACWLGVHRRSSERALPRSRKLDDKWVMYIFSLSLSWYWQFQMVR